MQMKIMFPYRIGFVQDNKLSAIRMLTWETPIMYPLFKSDVVLLVLLIILRDDNSRGAYPPTSKQLRRNSIQVPVCSFWVDDYFVSERSHYKMLCAT